MKTTLSAYDETYIDENYLFFSSGRLSRNLQVNEFAIVTYCRKMGYITPACDRKQKPKDTKEGFFDVEKYTKDLVTI